jgi:heme A synthase
MVKSGLKDKNETKEIDKTPSVSPYRLAIHAGFAYTLYGFCFWNALNLLRRPQESIITLKNMTDHNKARKILAKFAHSFLPFILLTGFFTAAIRGRVAVNTYPHVGEHWFITWKHF